MTAELPSSHIVELVLPLECGCSAVLPGKVIKVHDAGCALAPPPPIVDPPDVFTITIQGAYDLRLTELWPDGDAPERPTVEDVKALMESLGRKDRVLRDWDLIADLEVYVEDQRVWS